MRCWSAFFWCDIELKLIITVGDLIFDDMSTFHFCFLCCNCWCMKITFDEDLRILTLIHSDCHFIRRATQWGRESDFNCPNMSLIINSFVVSILLLLASTIDTTRIPFIDNTILVPRYLASFTIVHHQSIRQCLCSSLPWFVAFNWFPNSTCQLFVSFPIRYSIQPMMQARLYFPQQVFPNASRCCMPDTSDLLNKLMQWNFCCCQFAVFWQSDIRYWWILSDCGNDSTQAWSFPCSESLTSQPHQSKWILRDGCRFCQQPSISLATVMVRSTWSRAQIWH